MERYNALTGKSQSLRKNMTKEEHLLWYRFLRKYPVQFRRQYVIGNFIVDFFCHKAKLVIELDGSHHYEPEEIVYDQRRTRYLESQGLRVIRFSNLDVLKHFDQVCSAVDEVVRERMQPSLPAAQK